MASVQESLVNNRKTILIAIGYFFIAIATISVALRFYSRFLTKQRLGLDDWLMLASAIAFFVLTNLVILSNIYVLPDSLTAHEHTESTYVTTAQDVIYLKLAVIDIGLYYTTAGTSKLGILLMYNRIFAVSPIFRYQLLVVSSLVVAWLVWCFIATLTSCLPHKWDWINTLANPRYCLKTELMWLGLGVSEIILDTLIIMIPINVVVRMHLSLKQRLVAMGIFLLGGMYVLERRHNRYDESDHWLP
ncbi:hypothetical protein F4810DRAFT_715711 [Camillea tinctor]|nr:hypothetical protein F4810DRAFT_715711 [Camillea tinctor]